ncbi:MAG: MBOAT family O-acyltransferase, partial [Bacteroidota bacterium]
YIDYAVFVSFFPLLVAGPIERATHLLPQILKKRIFDFHDSIRGIELIIWGFFKKVVIADTMAIIVNQVYKDAGHFSGSSLAIAALAFSFQIYCDFSGYSDIAIGTAKLFGIELMQNFNYPYLSRNIAEFWKRWHISLSSWFRDYLYIPLGGSKVSRLLSVRNVFIVFLVSGIWHGANWTFVVWGGIHAALFVPSFISGSNKKFRDELISRTSPLPSLYDLFRIAVTFVLVTIAWIFFRSTSLAKAFDFLARIFNRADGNEIIFKNADLLSYSICFSVFFLMSIYLLYVKRQVFESGIVQRFLICVMLLVLIAFFGQFSAQTFIYYQF